MRRRWISGLMLAVLLCAVPAGCTDTGTVPIETMAWRFATVQNTQDGFVTACAEELAEQYPQAVPTDITCAFDGGVITIGTDKERHSGRYTLTETDGGNTALYEIDFDGKTGRMTSGITQYGDGAREGTLIITVGEYVVTFRASLAD